MAIVRIIAIVNNRRVDKLGDLKLYMIILIMIALILNHQATPAIATKQYTYGIATQSKTKKQEIYMNYEAFSKKTNNNNISNNK